ncbi:PRC-barrel domain-containing protein [Methanobrevibacter sp. OttesenSCG-928-K11]|nr:PRC-barrel domain-containing protein [Methanobrevibacter sp. OttesenSCG-928-K11]MDL2271295.1 PRC-barrel domain-containing protein [Methanobrevibacter sp. OttesenSCG-928-I08]
MRFLEDLIKKEVINSEAIIIGKVTDVSFNKETFEIEELIVKKGTISESIKASKGENLIPVDMIKNIGDKILLKGEFDL